MKLRLLLPLLILLSVNIFAQQPPDSAIVVGIKVSPPFIIQTENGKYEGVSIDLWEKIASQLNVQFSYKHMELPQLITSLENSAIDLAINPLTVTSDRIERMSFTQPFYISNLAIATRTAKRANFVSFFLNFFTWDFLKVVGLLFLIILLFGFLAWLFEREKNKAQFGPGIKGIMNGIWWSAVTMTTVGYGDKAPITPGGRIVAFIWMFTAIIIISGFTASIASSLTVNHLQSGITGIDDLKHVKNGTIQGSATVEWMNRKGFSATEYNNVPAALHALAEGEIDAVVFDEPILKYYIQKEKLAGRIILLPGTFAQQYYSFALPKGSKLRDLINPVLLQQLEDIRWKAVQQKYNLLD